VEARFHRTRFGSMSGRTRDVRNGVPFAFVSNLQAMVHRSTPTLRSVDLADVRASATFSTMYRKYLAGSGSRRQSCQGCCLT
jgi:hypothetical protein